MTRYERLEEFKERWSLSEYNSLSNHDSFCYWLEHIADELGRIKGNYSSMFGIW